VAFADLASVLVLLEPVGAGHFAHDGGALGCGEDCWLGQDGG